MKMICAHCGNKVEPDCKECPTCGYEFVEQSTDEKMPLPKPKEYKITNKDIKDVVDYNLELSKKIKNYYLTSIIIGSITLFITGLFLIFANGEELIGLGVLMLILIIPFISILSFKSKYHQNQYRYQAYMLYTNMNAQNKKD